MKSTSFQLRLLAALLSSLQLLSAGFVFLVGPDACAGVQLKQVADGFVSPLNLVPLPDGRLLIADQVGTVHVLNADGKLADTLFFDARSRLTKLNQGFDERGLLGLVLHPKFKANGKLYMYYSAPRRSNLSTNWDHTSTLSEFKVKADMSQIDSASERVLLQIDEPQFNHNCGRMAFGPDGLLYVGLGDGGQGNDVGFGHSPNGNGQDTTTLLGKILRLDVDRGSPYAIPADNPFADGKRGRPEIYAYGLRNPWGISFDRGGTRELFAADVGQNLYEELNIVVKGGNYGWRLREGFHAFDPNSPDKSPADSSKTDHLGQPLLDPILEYPHPPRNKVDRSKIQGISITGGYVYRGKALPQLQGKYIFADWSRTWALPDGFLLAASREAQGAKWTLEILTVSSPAGEKVGAYVTALGEDDDGELYVLTTGRNSLTGQTGKVFKMVPE